MKELLDTHVWLWLQAAPERLADDTLTRLADPETELFLSAASAWEIAIKFAFGKLALPEPPARYVPSRMSTSGTRALPISISHAVAVAALPRHHADPFDRLIIAQAQLEGLPVLTVDPQFAAYDVEVQAP